MISKGAISNSKRQQRKSRTWPPRVRCEIPTATISSLQGRNRWKSLHSPLKMLWQMSLPNLNPLLGLNSGSGRRSLPRQVKSNQLMRTYSPSQPIITRMTVKNIKVMAETLTISNSKRQQRKMRTWPPRVRCEIPTATISSLQGRSHWKSLHSPLKTLWLMSLPSLNPLLGLNSGSGRRSLPRPAVSNKLKQTYSPSQPIKTRMTVKNIKVMAETLRMTIFQINLRRKQVRSCRKPRALIRVMRLKRKGLRS